MATQIHPTAIISPEAELGVDVEIGPYTVVGAGVRIGDRCVIGPHCVFEGRTTLGPGNVIIAHAAIGTPPQDLKYAGEPTSLEIGAGNTIREFTTFNRGTAQGGSRTVIGDLNLFMTQAHVAHDCHVGNSAIFANAATLAGHVTIGDGATIGAFSAVHQFCRVGEQAFIGGFTVVTRDALPYMKTVGQRGDAKSFGPNRIGLERKGFAPDEIAALIQAHKRLATGDELLAEKLDRIAATFPDSRMVASLIAFIRASERGVILA